MEPIELLRPFVRDGDFPLEATSIFFSYKDALDYIHNDKSAYPAQIIGVDDKDLMVTDLYKVDYNPNTNDEFKYILKSISVSSNGTSLSFKGSVETTSKLPLINVFRGDLYLVKSESKFYIASVDKYNVVKWESIDVLISYASKTTDGIINAKTYSSLINNTGKDAVYFSNGKTDTPDDNKWIFIEHTKNETDTNYSIPSIGKLKELLGSMITSSVPHIELSTDLSLDQFINDTINPKIIIKYYPELGGTIRNIKIDLCYKSVVSTLYNDLPDNITNNDDCYSWEYLVKNYNITSTDLDKVEFKVYVSYNSTDDLPQAGTCSSVLTFNYYPAIVYGHNLYETKTYMKDNTKIVFNYTPKDFNNTIYKFYIKIPKNYNYDLMSVTYTPQHDIYAKDLFKKSESDNYIVYEYSISSSIGFTNPGQFIYYLEYLK